MRQQVSATSRIRYSNIPKRCVAMLTSHYNTAVKHRPCSGRRSTLLVHATNNGSSVFAYEQGAKVKVVKPVKVFHVAKHPQGLNLEGLVGEVAKNSGLHKGKVLSATLPFVVKFTTQLDGADIKFQAHLGDDELSPM